MNNHSLADRTRQMGCQGLLYEVRYGTAFPARVVGEKKAREIGYLCRRCTAAEAPAMGLVNAVVPHEQLDAQERKSRHRGIAPRRAGVPREALAAVQEVPEVGYRREDGGRPAERSPATGHGRANRGGIRWNSTRS
jgi:enoyl-CoA hydratase/carnithine racemase